jgi:hypothetical protein
MFIYKVEAIIIFERIFHFVDPFKNRDLYE